MLVPVINRFFQWFKVGLIMPVLILMMLSKGVELEWVGFISATLSICVILFEVPSGVFSDLFGRRKIYLIALVIEAMSVMIVFFGHSFTALLIGYGVYGISRAFSSGSIESLYIDHFIHTKGKDNLHKLITAMNISEASGLALGALLGGIIPMIYKTMQPITSIYNGNLFTQFVIILFLIFLTLLTPYQDEKKTKLSAKQIVKESYDFLRTNQVVKWLFFGTMVWGFVFNAVEIFWQPQLEGILGDQSATWIFGVVNSGYFIASILGSLAIGAVLNKFKWSVFAMMSVLRCFLGISIVLLSFQNQLGSFAFFFLFIMGFNGMLNVPESTAINHHVPENKRASLLSVASFLMQMGGALGAIVYSLILTQATVKVVWIVAGSIFALSAVIYFHLFRKEKKGLIHN